MKKITTKKSVKAASSQELLKPVIESWEAEIFLDVLKPQKSSMVGGDADSMPQYDIFVREDYPIASNVVVSQMAIQGLARWAKSGDKAAIEKLASQATWIIHFLNELADGTAKESKQLKVVASECTHWPQLVGKHPDVVKDSLARVKKIELGKKVKMKTGASDLPTQNQEWRHIIGGYASRLVIGIARARMAREHWARYIEREDELSQWVRDALALPPEKSKWCNFALQSLKMMNGGEYPFDFVARGRSNGEAYQRQAAVKKGGKGTKNQAIKAAETAFRKAWKARF